MKIASTVLLSGETSELLRELSKKRKGENAFIKTQVEIVRELILKAHKRECGK